MLHTFNIPLHGTKRLEETQALQFATLARCTLLVACCMAQPDGDAHLTAPNSDRTRYALDATHLAPHKLWVHVFPGCHKRHLGGHNALACVVHLSLAGVTCCVTSSHPWGTKLGQALARVDTLDLLHNIVRDRKVTDVTTSAGAAEVGGEEEAQQQPGMMLGFQQRQQQQRQQVMKLQGTCSVRC